MQITSGHLSPHNVYVSAQEAKTISFFYAGYELRWNFFLLFFTPGTPLALKLFTNFMEGAVSVRLTAQTIVVDRFAEMRNAISYGRVWREGAGMQGSECVMPPAPGHESMLCTTPALTLAEGIRVIRIKVWPP